MKFVVLALSAAITLPVAAAEEKASPFDISLGASFRYDENIGLAPKTDQVSHVDQEKDDVSSTVELTLNWQVVQDATREVSANVRPYYEGVQSLNDLTNYGASVGFSWREQFSSAFDSPYFSLAIDGRWMEFDDSEPRDGYQVDARLGIGKRFGPRFGAEIGYLYHYRVSTDDSPEGSIDFPAPLQANSADVFDLDRQGGFLHLDWFASERTTVFFEYNYLDGDVVSTGAPGNVNRPLFNDRFRDFAFEEGKDLVAYQIESEQNIYSVGLVQNIGESLTADLSVTFLDASGEEGNDYENTVVTLALIWAF